MRVAAWAPKKGKGPTLRVKVTAKTKGSCSITFADTNKHIARLQITVAPAPTATVFGYTGAAQTFKVPSGAMSLTIKAAGGQGGYAEGGGGSGGGLGGSVTATIPVTPGESLAIYVGGLGLNPYLYEGNAGGFNGGGSGGCGCGRSFGAAGSGGGASDVRRGGGTLSNRVVVAGGGGGGGYEGVVGGAGGGLTGGAGTGNTGYGGGGGTQVLGAPGAPSHSAPVAKAGTGSLGLGGNGGGYDTTTVCSTMVAAAVAAATTAAVAAAPGAIPRAEHLAVAAADRDLRKQPRRRSPLAPGHKPATASSRSLGKCR